VAIGEVGLTGEIRRVGAVGRRLAEAARLGFRVAVVPATRGGDAGERRTVDGMTVLEAGDLPAALRALGLARTGRAESHPLD